MAGNKQTQVKPRQAQVKGNGQRKDQQLEYRKLTREELDRLTTTVDAHTGTAKRWSTESCRRNTEVATFEFIVDAPVGCLATPARRALTPWLP